MSWKNVQYENGKYRTSESGGGGASNFADLDDVSFSNLQNGQVAKYNSTTQKWENANESKGVEILSKTFTVGFSGGWSNAIPLGSDTIPVNSIILWCNGGTRWIVHRVNSTPALSMYGFNTSNGTPIGINETLTVTVYYIVV